MLERLLFGAVATGVAWLMLRRWCADELIERHYTLDDAERGFALLDAVVECEYVHHGVESRCSMSAGIARVLTSRRGHDHLSRWDGEVADSQLPA